MCIGHAAWHSAIHTGLASRREWSDKKKKKKNKIMPQVWLGKKKKKHDQPSTLENLKNHLFRNV